MSLPPYRCTKPGCRANATSGLRCPEHQLPRAPSRLVVLESPYGTRADGTRASPEEVDANVAYAREALLDSLARGEAPYASHLLYPQVLADARPDERLLGMAAGFAWGALAHACVVYTDLGVTAGMKEGVARARAAGQTVEFRSLPTRSQG